MTTVAVPGFSAREKAARTKKAGARAANSRRGLNAYLAVMTLGAAALTAMFAVYRPFSSSTNILLGAALIALICIAEMYPIHVAPKTKVSVTMAAIFTAVLLFNPLTAVIVAGGGDCHRAVAQKERELA